jgi:hypothetical protein
VARIKVEAAPATLSWSIGAVGLPDLGANGRAVWEHYGRPVSPASLYLAQRADSDGGSPALVEQQPAPERARTVFLHYLPWYTIDPSADYAQARRGWCGVGAAVAAAECADTGAERRRQYTGEGPLIGEYSQREPAVLQYHLLLAQASPGRHCHSTLSVAVIP